MATDKNFSYDPINAILDNSESIPKKIVPNIPQDMSNLTSSKDETQGRTITLRIKNKTFQKIEKIAKVERRSLNFIVNDLLEKVLALSQSARELSNL